MTGNTYADGALPAADERQEILERAGLVLKQAQALCKTLDQSEGKLTWSVENGRTGLEAVGFRRTSNEGLSSDSISEAV